MGLKGLLSLAILIATFLLIYSEVALPARELTETPITKDYAGTGPPCTLECCRRGFYGDQYYGGPYYGYRNPYYGYGNPYSGYGNPYNGNPYNGGPICCCHPNYAGQEGRHAKP